MAANATTLAKIRWAQTGSVMIFLALDEFDGRHCIHDVGDGLRRLIDRLQALQLVFPLFFWCTSLLRY